MDLGAVSQPPLRLALLHLLLDAFSNSAGGIGVDKLLAMAGAAALVAYVQPHVRELFAGAVAAGSESGWDLSAILENLKAAIL